jgi:hypothetical protein
LELKRRRTRQELGFDPPPGDVYGNRVLKNFQHMDTAPFEWSAVPIGRTATVTNDRGGSVEMPEFNFPVGYAPAPSLFKSGAVDASCELCGRPHIKNVFWLQNDEKKWLLPVGSECVTHFGEGYSGKDMQKKTKNETNSALANEFRDVWNHFASAYRFAEQNHDWTTVSRLRERMRAVANTLPREDAKPASFTRWVNDKGDRAREFLTQASAILAHPAVSGGRVGQLEAKIKDSEGWVEHYEADIAAAERAKEQIPKANEGTREQRDGVLDARIRKLRDAVEAQRKSQAEIRDSIERFRGKYGQKEGPSSSPDRSARHLAARLAITRLHREGEGE